jgi:hypothetical protein
MEYFSFDTIFTDEKFANHFVQYLEGIHCDELLKFVLYVEKFKALRQCSDPVSQ